MLLNSKYIPYMDSRLDTKNLIFFFSVGHRDIKTTRLWSGTSSIRKSEFEDIVSLRKKTARISEVLDLKLSEHETCVQLQTKLEISEERLREQNQKIFTVQNEYQSYKDEMFKEIEDLKSKLLQEQLNYASLEKHCDDLNCEKTVRGKLFLPRRKWNLLNVYLLKSALNIFRKSSLIYNNYHQKRRTTD